MYYKCSKVSYYIYINHHCIGCLRKKYIGCTPYIGYIVYIRIYAYTIILHDDKYGTVEHYARCTNYYSKNRVENPVLCGVEDDGKLELFAQLNMGTVTNSPSSLLWTKKRLIPSCPTRAIFTRRISSMLYTVRASTL